MFVQVACAPECKCLKRPKVSDPPSRVEVVDCCELPDMGAENRTQGFCENSMHLTAKPFFQLHMEVLVWFSSYSIEVFGEVHRNTHRNREKMKTEKGISPFTSRLGNKPRALSVLVRCRLAVPRGQLYLHEFISWVCF